MPPWPVSGGEEFYPDFCDKAAVLLVRLAKNHHLLDGNKRAAWVTLRISSSCLLRENQRGE
jgi:prophage maintenance system killer protein